MPHSARSAYRPGPQPRRRPPIAVVAAVAALIQLVATAGQWHHNAAFSMAIGSPLYFDTVSALLVPLALVGPVALLWLRRHAGVVVIVTAAAAASGQLLTHGLGTPLYLSVFIAAVGAVAAGSRWWAWGALGGAWLTVLVVGIAGGIQITPGGVAFSTFAGIFTLGVAEAVRARRERWAQQERDALANRQKEAQAERVRIARELHDVLAHSLSQINVQAGVGLHLIDRQPELAAETLANIKATSKTALDEVRQVLGVLRADPGLVGDGEAPLTPEPDLTGLELLASGFRLHGLDVELELGIEAPAEVPKPVALALYRIAQESLTNVTRHSEAGSAVVELGEEPRAYVLRVSDAGPGLASVAQKDGLLRGARPAPEGGRGLLGMRERVELLGGTFSAGPAPSGGFEVRVEIPKQTARGRHP